MERITVLLIDDVPAIRTTLRQWLEEDGYDVVEAEDGNAGLSALARSGVDLVITDIFMPGMEGLETIITIRKSFPSMKIIAISNAPKERGLDYLRIAERLGADRGIAKPFPLGVLLDNVRHVLGTRPEDAVS